MDDLKNCPFCGAPAEAEYRENELGMGLVRCTEGHMRYLVKLIQLSVFGMSGQRWTV